MEAKVNPTPTAAPVLPTPSVPAQVSLPYAKRLSGWATFIAILQILGGALACLGIITAAIGVPYIIAGVKLLRAINISKDLAEPDSSQKIGDVFTDLNSYFKINGIMVIVQAILAFLFIIAMFAGMVAAGTVLKENGVFNNILNNINQK